MSIIVGGKKVIDIKYQGKSIKRVMHQGKQIWPDEPTDGRIMWYEFGADEEYYCPFTTSMPLSERDMTNPNYTWWNAGASKCTFIIPAPTNDPAWSRDYGVNYCLEMKILEGGNNLLFGSGSHNRFSKGIPSAPSYIPGTREELENGNTRFTFNKGMLDHSKQQVSPTFEASDGLFRFKPISMYYYVL